MAIMACFIGKVGQHGQKCQEERKQEEKRKAEV